MEVAENKPDIVDIADYVGAIQDREELTSMLVRIGLVAPAEDPSQFYVFDRLAEKQYTAEQKLYRAILEQGLIDGYQNPRKSLKSASAMRLRSNAQKWVRGEGFYGYMDFDNVCTNLRLDAGYLRRKLNEKEFQNLRGKTSDRRGRKSANLTILPLRGRNRRMHN